MRVGQNDWGPGAAYMYRRLKMNKSLVTTSPAMMCDDGDSVEYVSHRDQTVDLIDEAIQLWQSHGTGREGTWPNDNVINKYVHYVKARK